MMKPFDLEAAQRGEPIQMRCGEPCEFVAHRPTAKKSQQVVVQIGGTIGCRTLPGHVYDETCATSMDVVMAPKRMVKKSGWFLSSPEHLNDPLKNRDEETTRQEAKKQGKHPIFIQWEEEA
jgi:hypothetical protein